jgi:hypothetical protein
MAGRSPRLNTVRVIRIIGILLDNSVLLVSVVT